jgi:hypothetical protein
MLGMPKLILKLGLRFWRVGMLFGCVGWLTTGVIGQQKPSIRAKKPTDASLPVKEPVPRWIVPRKADSLLTTSDTLLVMSYDGLAVLDRQDGRVLWQIEGLHTDATQGTLRTIETKVSTLVGVTTTSQMPQVVVLLSWQMHSALDTAHYANRKVTWQADLEGKELRTGRLLWHSALALDPGSQATELPDHLIWYPQDVYGETIILHKRGTLTDTLFQDARTGASLDPTRPQDLSLLQSSAALHGEHSLHWDTLRDGTLLRLDPNAALPLTLSGSPGWFGLFLGRVGNKMVWLEVTDDGSTGHSVYPNYIICSDANGNILWQFPPNRVDTSDLGVLFRNKRLLGDGVVDPLGRVVLAQDRGNRVYTLDMATGKPISTLSGGSVWNLLPYGHGYIDYNKDTGLVRYLDGRTGKVEKVVRLRLGTYSKLLLAGSDFVFVDWKGKQPQLLYYTRQDLLGL